MKSKSTSSGSCFPVLFINSGPSISSSQASCELGCISMILMMGRYLKMFVLDSERAANARLGVLIVEWILLRVLRTEPCSFHQSRYRSIFTTIFCRAQTTTSDAVSSHLFLSLSNCIV